MLTFPGGWSIHVRCCRARCCFGLASARARASASLLSCLGSWHPPLVLPPLPLRRLTHTRTLRPYDCVMWHVGSSDGTKFEGDFKNGKFEGFGIYMRADGMKFEGQFTDGKCR